MSFIDPLSRDAKRYAERLANGVLALPGWRQTLWLGRFPNVSGGRNRPSRVHDGRRFFTHGRPPSIRWTDNRRTLSMALLGLRYLCKMD